MKSVGVFEAKTTFSKLLARVRRGETVLITSDGEPVAELGPVRQAEHHRAERVLALVDEVRKSVRERGGGGVSYEQIRQWITEGRK